MKSSTKIPIVAGGIALVVAVMAIAVTLSIMTWGTGSPEFINQPLPRGYQRIDLGREGVIISFCDGTNRLYYSGGTQGGRTLAAVPGQGCES